MHDTPVVKHLETLSYSAADPPDLALLNYPLIPLRFVNQITQEVTLRRILHGKEEVPISMLVLLEKAMIELDEMRGRQLFEKRGFALY